MAANATRYGNHDHAVRDHRTLYPHAAATPSNWKVPPHPAASSEVGTHTTTAPTAARHSVSGETMP